METFLQEQGDNPDRCDMRLIKIHRPGTRGPPNLSVYMCTNAISSRQCWHHRSSCKMFSYALKLCVNMQTQTWNTKTVYLLFLDNRVLWGPNLFERTHNGYTLSLVQLNDIVLRVFAQYIFHWKCRLVKLNVTNRWTLGVFQLECKIVCRQSVLSEIYRSFILTVTLN